MSADEHRTEAAKHHQQGDAHDGQAATDPSFGIDLYNLDGYHTIDANVDHALAEEHIAAAESLEAFEDASAQSSRRRHASVAP